MIFKVNNISKQFQDHKALTDVNLEVPDGTIFGLLGPNGAGKTTFIRIINQIMAPDTGEIFIGGEKLKPEHVHDIGYLPEERGLYKKMKVGEQALYLARLKGMSKKEAKEALKMWFEKFEITDWWNKKVEELSKGMAQKIQFVTTVIHNPKILILDEPFSGFDPINADLIKEEILQLRNQGTSIFLSTHNMGSVEEVCEYIALLNNSEKILEGKVSEIRNQYSKNIYAVHYTGELEAAIEDDHRFRTVSIEKKPDLNVAKIQIREEKPLKTLLRVLVENDLDIHSVIEVIPSMRDIFIETVSQSNTLRVQ